MDIHGQDCGFRWNFSWPLDVERRGETYLLRFSA